MFSHQALSVPPAVLPVFGLIAVTVGAGVW
jgi:hypothetical protein